MEARQVFVVGAGAAGLTAAIRAAESGARVALLNAHPKIGLKILMSGGTRCNVTHREVTADDFWGGSRPFVARILREFTPEQTRAWMESIGVQLKLEDTGKYFPLTDDAQTVLDALVHRVDGLGVGVQSGARVVRLERDAAAGFRVGVQDVKDSAAFTGERVAARGVEEWPLPAAEPDHWVHADAVVLATGGLSFPRTGSDGVGYGLAAALGHTIVPPVPGLTPLVGDDPPGRSLQGVTLDAELALWIDGKRTTATRGSFLFTHFGYSGPAALDLSRHWHGAEGSERRVTANFVPTRSPVDIGAEWLTQAAAHPQRSAARIVAASVPERLAGALCEEAGVQPETAMSQVPREQRKALLTTLTGRTMPVTGTLGYEKAEVTAGGVELSEVNPSTLESRKVPGLYLCGEILDVEGRLGGFNFQWSWSSGTVAGRAAANG